MQIQFLLGSFCIFLMLNAAAEDINVKCEARNLELVSKWGMAAARYKPAENDPARIRNAVNKLNENKGDWKSAKIKMPIYNQGITGLCYAYTAIELFDYWRQIGQTKFSTNDIALSSPVYAAILTRLYNSWKNDLKGLDDLEGGDTPIALVAIKKLGMCRPDYINSVLSKFAKSNNIKM